VSPVRRTLKPASAATKKKTADTLRSSWPLVVELIRPRRAMFALGLLLTLVNSVCGIVLPGSTKFLIDNVIGKHQTQWLIPLVGAVLVATLIQGATSYSLTQLLSKEAQRLIAEMRRRKVQAARRTPAGWLLRFANKTGALVSRIMTDVEGVRNLVGTGLVDFVGGILTALFSLAAAASTSARC
jgi:ABC-type multidrug transport system fused ATPase/permease subunit